MVGDVNNETGGFSRSRIELFLDPVRSFDLYSVCKFNLKLKQSIVCHYLNTEIYRVNPRSLAYNDNKIIVSLDT